MDDIIDSNLREFVSTMFLATKLSRFKSVFLHPKKDCGKIWVSSFLYSAITKEINGVYASLINLPKSLGHFRDKKGVILTPIMKKFKEQPIVGGNFIENKYIVSIGGSSWEYNTLIKGYQKELYYNACNKLIKLLRVGGQSTKNTPTFYIDINTQTFKEVLNIKNEDLDGDSTNRFPYLNFITDIKTKRTSVRLLYQGRITVLNRTLKLPPKTAIKMIENTPLNFFDWPRKPCTFLPNKLTVIKADIPIFIPKTLTVLKNEKQYIILPTANVE